jgi:DNA-binding PadR family transcriptional regulator
MLTHGEAHGYRLLDELDEFGFNPDRFDPSVIYRALREMEFGGWVTSRWDTESQGPRRRVYEITPEGKEYLQLWVMDLRRTRQEIDTLISAYEQIEAELER